MILMAVILAIKPKYADLILSGTKKMELRKRLWNEHKKIKKAYIYASDPIKKLVGYFEVADIYRGSIHILWTFSKHLSCLSKEEFDKYYANHTHGTCILIENVKKFKAPINPFDLDPEFKIPQNFCYVSKELESKLDQIEVEVGNG